MRSLVYVGAAASILASGCSRNPSTATRSDNLCFTNLTALYRATARWGLEYLGDDFPPDLESIATNVEPAVLVCPASGHKPGPRTSVIQWTDYIYVAKRTRAEVDIPLIICPPENHQGKFGHILSENSETARLSPDEVRALINNPWLHARVDQISEGVRVQVPDRYKAIYTNAYGSATRTNHGHPSAVGTLSDEPGLSASATNDTATFSAQTNEIPTYLKWLSYNPPSWRDSVRSNASRLPYPLSTTAINSPILSPDAERRSYLALDAFQQLGTNAVSALPELTRMSLDTNGPLSSKQATIALADLGTYGLPVLMAALTNANHPQRAIAACGFGSTMYPLGSNLAPAIPLLIQCATDPDSEVRRQSINSLALLSRQPSIGHDALKQCLRNSLGGTGGFFIRAFAVRSLALLASNGPPEAAVLDPQLADWANELQRDLLGTWRSEEFSSNMRQFNGSTNLGLAIQRVALVFTNPAPQPPSALLQADLITTWPSKTGDRFLPHRTSCGLIELTGNQLIFQLPPRDYTLNFALQTNALTLQRQTSGEHLTAKLRRLKTE